MKEQAERVDKARREYIAQHGCEPGSPLAVEEKKQIAQV